MAKPKPKKTDKVDYRNCKIEILHYDTDTEIRVDGKTVDIQRDSDTGAYLSPEAPYQTYATPEEAAKAVVDRRQE